MRKTVSKNLKDMKKRILISATKNFAKNGYSGTSLRNIALSAKISKGGLYHHFPSKEDLFIAVFSRANDLIWEKTLELFGKKDYSMKDREKNLFVGLSEYYDIIILGAKDLEILWIEGIMESIHNTKLKKMLLKRENENVKMGTEILKQTRDNTNLLHGYSDDELYNIANGFSVLHRGIILDRVMGKDPKEIRLEWIRTVYAIYKSKK